MEAFPLASATPSQRGRACGAVRSMFAAEPAALLRVLNAAPVAQPVRTHPIGGPRSVRPENVVDFARIAAGHITAGHRPPRRADRITAAILTSPRRAWRASSPLCSRPPPSRWTTASSTCNRPIGAERRPHGRFGMPAPARARRALAHQATNRAAAHACAVSRGAVAADARGLDSMSTVAR
jgi:hypothetical protein